LLSRLQLAHPHLHRCCTLNDKGKKLEDFISQEGLCIFNDGTDTYLHPGNGSYSAIDFTVTDLSLLLDFSWKVHDDLCGSDHFPIILESLHSTVEEIKSSSFFPLSVVVLLPRKGLCPLKSPMMMNGVGN
jgi:hypothetical protein